MCRLVVSLCIILLLPVASFAAPLDLALQQQLLALYDQYNKAIQAGKLADATALRTAAARAEIEKELKKGKKAQAEFIEMSKQMTPDSVEALHATTSHDGTQATILTLGARTIPANVHIAGGPKPGTVMHSEITLIFKQEAKQWKFDEQDFGVDPASVKACSDDAVEPTANYDDGKDVSLGGVIRKVEFKPDHTLLVVRIVDEDTCAILPNREKLQQLGMNVSLLVPYATVEMEGSPHRKDKQRAYIDKLRVLADE
jgi:hypothetical protein